MKRKFFLITYCILSYLLLYGCASTAVPLKQGEFKQISAIKVVCKKTPEIRRHSASSITAGGLLLGGFGEEALAQRAGRMLREKCSLPDFNQLVMTNFVNNIPKEIENWPAMKIEKNIVKNDYIPQTGYALCFEVGYVWLYSYGGFKGLSTHGLAEIIPSKGERIWFHQYSYREKDFGEVPELEELEADNCKLLKKQMNFAAKKASNELIKDIKTGLIEK